jgi:hypothetical protein
MYSIIFWANSPHSKTIFKFKKEAIRNITHSGNRGSCQDKFKELKIPTPLAIYFLSTVVCCKEQRNV